MSGLVSILRSDARPTALHEAGHSVIALAMGFPQGEIAIEVSPMGCSGHSETDLQERFQSFDDVQTYLRSRITVLYAGCMAQALTDAGVDQTLAGNMLATTASDDFSKIRENLRVLVGVSDLQGMEYPEHLSTMNDELWGLAVAAVEEHRQKIERVADALIEKIDGAGLRVTLSAHEIEKL